MLHPQTQKLLDLIVQSGARPTHTLTPAEARTSYSARKTLTQPTPPEVADVRDFCIPGPAGKIPLRAYRPLGSDPCLVLPVLVYYHGGGWVIGDLDTHDTLCRELANASGCAVISVAYRLAPEHRFPAAFNDALAAARWISGSAHGLGVDSDRLAVGGDSAGGNLAAAVTLAARDNADGKGPLSIAYQLLIYPGMDMRLAHVSHQTNGRLEKPMCVWHDIGTSNLT